MAILSLALSAAETTEAYVRLSSPDDKPNRRTIFRDLEGSKLYRTTPGEKETTHTIYRKSLRESRQQMLIDELKLRGGTYRDEELKTTVGDESDEPRDKRTKPGSAYTPLHPLRIPEAATTRLLRIRGKLRETTIKEEECRGLSGARLARCQYERQREKGEGAPQMIEEEEAPE